MKPYWRDVVVNKELEQALNKRYGEVIDLTNNDTYSVICNLFENNKSCEKILLENNFDYNLINEDTMEVFEENCNIVTKINNTLYKVKSNNEEYSEFNNKDEEIKYLKNKLKLVSNEVSSIEKTLSILLDNNTHILQNYLALHSLYTLDNYSSNLAIDMVLKSSTDGMDILEKVSYIDGYSSAASLNNENILNRIDRLDNDLIREINNR